LVFTLTKVLIVGSGAGGGILASELSQRGVEVTIIEKGPSTPPGDAHCHYDTINTGVEILKTHCVGGTTMVTAGNAVRTCQDELKKLNIDVGSELDQVEEEVGVTILPDSLLGEGTRILMDSARRLGLSMEKMPKFIDPRLCKPCGKCALGCPRNAKWNSRHYLKNALNMGACLIENRPVVDVLLENGKLKGVRTHGKDYYADVVVLSSGAIATPRLLKRAGLEAGAQLFVDTFITIGGVLEKIGFNEEVQMNALLRRKDLIISPHFSSILVDKIPGAAPEDILGMMVKIKDDNQGQVTSEEVVKYSTARDVGLLSEGAALAGSILVNAGADPTRLVSTPARGAHPGGTAAIGSVVDSNLETEIENLFVADASVLPSAPGAPPVLTILALAKRLGRYIYMDRA